MRVGNSQNLNHVSKFPINHQERKPPKQEFASTVIVTRPALRRVRDKLDCLGYLLCKTRGHQSAALKVPVERSKKLTLGRLDSTLLRAMP
jgi:hypothetical protein